MSPEQLQGFKIDGRSDLFSLAVSLYQMACGRLPFVGDSMAQLMFRIANDPVPDILTFNPDIPPALVAVLNRALIKDPTQRYQSGEEFAAELRAVFGGGAVSVATAPVQASIAAAPRAAVPLAAPSMADLQPDAFARTQPLNPPGDGHDVDIKL